jgi:hypothetical protein
VLTLTDVMSLLFNSTFLSLMALSCSVIDEETVLATGWNITSKAFLVEFSLRRPSSQVKKRARTYLSKIIVLFFKFPSG